MNRARPTNVTFVSMLGLALSACSQGPAHCSTPDSSAACTCPGGSTGVQTCGAGGAQGACECRADGGGVFRDTTLGVIDPDATVIDVRRPGTLAGGFGHTCEAVPDGTVRCWGSNFYGALGDGTRRDQLGPVVAVGLSDAVGIAAAGPDTGDSSCALRANGTVACWGAWIGSPVTSPRILPGLDDAIAIAGGGSGGNFFCSIRASGQVACWTEWLAAPTLRFGVSDAVEVVVRGSSLACVRRAVGAVRCFGGTFLQPVPGTFTGSDAESGVTDAVGVAVTANGACVLRATGAVHCWGVNDLGQLGDGTTVSRATPAAVVGLDDAVDLAAGFGHVCARRAGGAIVCWGLNDFGQIGDGTNTNRLAPTPVVGLVDAIDLAAGEGHTCAHRADGSAVCWGYNEYGGLGDGTRTNQFTPVPVLP